LSGKMGTNRYVRVTDLADKLRVTKASVNRAVEKLAALKLVGHERYGTLTLTLQGETEARKVQKRQRNFIFSKMPLQFLKLNHFLRKSTVHTS
jgi:Mn-dependent DtxR family transcriptional regulator